MRSSATMFTSFVLLLSITLSGCKQELKDFSFSYSMESVNNFKIIVSWKSDQTYKIERYNYFMDNHANTRRPVILEGKLNEEEFKSIKKILTDANLFKLKDSYGFEKENDNILGEILYQIAIDTDTQSKFISIRNVQQEDLPKGYLNLVRFINNFLSKHQPE